MTEFEEDLHAPDPETIRRVNVAVGHRRPQDTPQGMRPLSDPAGCVPEPRTFCLVLHSPCKTPGGKPRGFPDRNDANAAAGGKFRSGHAKMERHWRDWVAARARKEAKRQGWKAPRVPVTITLEFREASTKRDADNVGWFEKPLIDGMRDAGVIEDDDQRHIVGFPERRLRICPRDPGVTVWVQAGRE